MLGNVLVLFVVLLITSGLGYLFLRSLRAKRMWVKIAGGLSAGLGTVLAGFITITGATGMVKTYTLLDPPVPANLKVDASPEQIARGKYIVTISCAGCHSSDPNNRMAPLTGGDDIAREIPMPVGTMIVSNIASDGAIKDYTDTQLFRAIRHGVRNDGSRLAVMSTTTIRQYSDEDTKSIIAYLRSQPPAQSNQRGGDSLNFLAAILLGAGLFPEYTPSAETIAAIPPAITPNYGEYVATLGDCRNCHGPDMTGTAASMTSPGAPNPRPYVSTLTVDQFRQMMHTGKRPDGSELKMPWQNASFMTDDDLAALYAYLKAQP